MRAGEAPLTRLARAGSARRARPGPPPDKDLLNPFTSLTGHLLDEVLVAHAAGCHSAIYYRHKNLLGEKREFSGSTTEVKPVAPDC